MILVAVAGIDGSGKSTLVNNLTNLLEARGKKVQQVSIWDPLKESSFFQTKEQVGKYLVTLSEQARALFIFHSLYQAMHTAFLSAEKNSTEILIIDSYWYKYFATEAARGLPVEWLNALVSLFPPCDYVFHLSLNKNIAYSRKESITPYERLHMENSLDVYFDQWSEMYALGGPKWMILNSAKAPLELAEECMLHLKKDLKL